MFSRESLKASMPATHATLHGVVFEILVSGEKGGLPSRGSPRRGPWLWSVFAFAPLKLRRTPRFALQAPHGCATRSPQGEAWWARQPPYEAAFLVGFLGFIKMLIQRVPTKIPTKLPRGRRSAAGVQSPAALWSSIASDRTMKVARSLSVGECIFEVGPARAGRLSVPRRALASRSLKIGW
jgi:hypothetical protein